MPIATKTKPKSKQPPARRNVAPHAHSDIRVVTFALDKLRPYERNPRRNDAVVPKMVASIKEFGFKIPILAKSDGSVIDGHLRLKAAAELKLKAVPAILCDEWTDAQIKAFRLLVNRSVSWADWDTDLLKLEMADLEALDFDLSLTGFDDLEIKNFLAPMAAADDSAAENIPAIPRDPITRQGDIWLLGDHRLICGDCRDTGVIEKLFGDQKAKANLIFTSPPYASQREYDPSSGFKPIPPDEYVEWYIDIAANIRTIIASDGSYFLNIKEGCEDGERQLYVKDLVLAHKRQWGWRFRDELIWKHGGFPGEYKYRHRNQFEPIFHFTTNHDIKHNPYAVGVQSDHIRDNRGGRAKGGGRMVATNQEHDPDAGNSLPFKSGIAQVGNVLEIPVNTEHTGHKAVFPQALPAFFIKAFSDARDHVFDPFMGSGSTLIAAQKNKRRGLGCEISPAYCDVIVKRWQDFTGQQATLDGDGRTFADIGQRP